VRNNERISLYYPVLLKFDCLFFYCFAIDEKILSLYAKGMTTTDIKEQIKELYDV